MHKIFTVQIVILLHFTEVFAENKTDSINALEKEKSELLKQINKAIDESVSVLKDKNDTESELGVNYMISLKEQLKHMNETSRATPNDTRRNNLLKLNMYDLARVLKKNTRSKGEENKLIIKKKIQEWIEEREKEKIKIKKYREKQKLLLRIEKCPRYGIAARGKKVGGSKTKSKARPRYPCCRKCCKSSYMGCL